MNAFRHNSIRSINQKWNCQPITAAELRLLRSAVARAAAPRTKTATSLHITPSMFPVNSVFTKPTLTKSTLTTGSSSRYLSTVSPPTAPTTGSGAAANRTGNEKEQDQKKGDKPNLFLDNLGTIFLTVIGLIIVSLVRSFYGSTRKNDLRKHLEEASALDPLEVDDLRFANPFISVPVFRSLIAEIRTAFPEGEATYREVVLVVRKALQAKHSIPTIELGYLLDRVALQIAQEGGTTTTETQSVTLWLVLLSLALNAPVPDRIRILYEILESDTTATSAGGSSTVTLLQVRDLVSYLQSTSQLVLDTQVLPTDNRAYPIQSYHRGTPDELVRWDAGGLYDPIDIDALAAILRSKSVCAWGECYSKQKFI